LLHGCTADRVPSQLENTGWDALADQNAFAVVYASNELEQSGASASMGRATTGNNRRPPARMGENESIIQYWSTPRSRPTM